MSVLFTYFSAATDEIAAAAIDQVSGPEGPDHDALELKGIDPVVQAGTLEAILNDVAYDDVVSDPRSGGILAERDGGMRLILSLTDGLQAGLAGLTSERAVAVAAEWAQTEEFQMGPPVTAEQLTVPLRELAGLAQRASERSERLYCWLCV